MRPKEDSQEPNHTQLCRASLDWILIARGSLCGFVH